MGTVDDLAIATAKADSASSWIWICRSSRQGQAESVIGAAAEGTAQQSARFSRSQWSRRMARNPTRQEDRLIPKRTSTFADCCGELETGHSRMHYTPTF